MLPGSGSDRSRFRGSGRLGAGSLAGRRWDWIVENAETDFRGDRTGRGVTHRNIDGVADSFVLHASDVKVQHNHNPVMRTMSN